MTAVELDDDMKNWIALECGKQLDIFDPEDFLSDDDAESFKLMIEKLYERVTGGKYEVCYK